MPGLSLPYVTIASELLRLLYHALFQCLLENYIFQLIKNSQILMSDIESCTR